MVPAMGGSGPPQPPPPSYPAPVMQQSYAAAGGAFAPVVQTMKAQCSPGCKLYIKGLPVHSDDLYLYKAFSPFGRILEAVVLPKGSYTIGFLTYASDQEAEEAIQNINGV